MRYSGAGQWLGTVGDRFTDTGKRLGVTEKSLTGTGKWFSGAGKPQKHAGKRHSGAGKSFLNAGKPLVKSEKWLFWAKPALFRQFYSKLPSVGWLEFLPGTPRVLDFGHCLNRRWRSTQQATI